MRVVISIGGRRREQAIGFRNSFWADVPITLWAAQNVVTQLVPVQVEKRMRWAA